MSSSSLRQAFANEGISLGSRQNLTSSHTTVSGSPDASSITGQGSHGLEAGAQRRGRDVREGAQSSSRRNQAAMAPSQGQQTGGMRGGGGGGFGGGNRGAGRRGSQGENRSGPGVAHRKDGQIDLRTVEGPDRRAGEKATSEMGKAEESGQSSSSMMGLTRSSTTSFPSSSRRGLYNQRW